MTYPPPHIPLWINSVRKEVIHSLIQLPPEGGKKLPHAIVLLEVTASKVKVIRT